MGEDDIITLASLVGKDLTGFSVKKLFEVYMIDGEGEKTESVGFFETQNVAEVLVQQQNTIEVTNNPVDAKHYRTEEVIILTDGEIGFLLGEPITILDDEEARTKIRENVHKKGYCSNVKI